MGPYVHPGKTGWDLNVSSLEETNLISGISVLSTLIPETKFVPSH